MSRKRLRDPATIDTELVEIYEDLANEREDIRLKAARSLLSKVSPEKSPTRERLVEILTRLVRGLCSARKAARVGFSVALTEFLVQLQGNGVDDRVSHLDIREVLEILQKQTVTVGDNTGTEAKNYDYGRLFGAEAVFKSGALFRSVDSTDCWKRILDFILELAKKRTWLRRDCGWILFSSIDLSNKNADYIQLLLEKIQRSGLSKTPEGIAVWLKAQSTGLRLRFPEKIWHKDDPLHRREKTILANVLKETTPAQRDQQNDTDRANQMGNWSPNLHFAWDVVIATLLDQRDVAHPKNKKQGHRIAFEEFWKEAVDDRLLSEASSNHRKYWGFLLFQHLVSTAISDVLPSIFTRNLVRRFLSQLASSERYLHNMAERTLKSISKRLDREPSVGFIVLSGLISPPSGSISFNQIVKSKIIEKLLDHVDEGVLVRLLPTFSQILARPGEEDEGAATTSRHLVADQLVSIIKNKYARGGGGTISPSGPDLLVGSVLPLFAEYAYFIREQSSSIPPTVDPPISEASREMFKLRVSSCLRLTLAKCPEPAFVYYGLLSSIRKMDREENFLKIVFKSDDAVGKTVESAWMTLEKIHSKHLSAHGDRKQLLSAFELLYSLTLLEVFNGEAEAVGILDELKASYDNLLKHKQKSNSGSSDGLIEILLSFVSKPSTLYRQMAQQVFSASTSNITSQGLQSMIKVLKTMENFAGQNDIFEQDEDEKPNTSGEENFTDASDVAMAETEINGVDKDEAEASSAGSSDEAPDEELSAFNAKLALALGTRSATDDLAVNDGDESSASDMNDEQMEALDEHLEKVFHERKKVKSKKTQNKDAKEAIVNFKCRVLDLLDIYIKQQHTNPLTLDLLIPLLEVMRTTKSPLVSNKVGDVLRNHFKRCTSNSMPTFSDLEFTINMLREIHDLACKEGSNIYGAACSQASLIVVKALAAQNREYLRVVTSVYGTTHERFLLDPKSKVKPAFFTAWLNWSVSARKAFIA